MNNKLKNKVALLISVGNTLILVLLIAIGAVVITTMRQLSSITTDIYKHPFTVNNAALVVRFNIEHMRDHMLEIALSRDSNRAESLSAELAALDGSVRENFKEVEANFLGDPEKIMEAHRLLDDWRDARIRTIDLARLGQWDQVINLVSNANNVTFVQLSTDVDDIIKFTREKAEAFTKQSSTEAMTEASRIVWLLASFATAIFIIGLEMSRRTWLLINAEEKAAEAASNSEKKYRSLFDNMLEGFAHCRMIYENGQPQDFIYLDVNGAFEQLTGLKDVTGKKVSEVIPGVRESNPELLAIYGRVALTGKPEQFETCVKDAGDVVFCFSLQYGKRRFYSGIQQHYQS